MAKTKQPLYGRPVRWILDRHNVDKQLLAAVYSSDFSAARSLIDTVERNELAGLRVAQTGLWCTARDCTVIVHIEDTPSTVEHSEVQQIGKWFLAQSAGSLTDFLRNDVDPRMYGNCYVVEYDYAIAHNMFLIED